MSLLAITPQPSGEETFHSQVVALERVQYRVITYTNATDERWYLSFGPEGGARINGIALAAGVDLLEPYRYLDDMPPGFLFVSGERDPDLTAFAEGRAQLLYLEAT